MRCFITFELYIGIDFHEKYIIVKVNLFDILRGAVEWKPKNKNLTKKYLGGGMGGAGKSPHSNPSWSQMEFTTFHPFSCSKQLLFHKGYQNSSMLSYILTHGSLGKLLWPSFSSECMKRIYSCKIFSPYYSLFLIHICNKIMFYCSG